MPSLELQRSPETVQEVELESSRGYSSKRTIKKKNKSCMPRIGCFRSEHDHSIAKKSNVDRSPEIESASTGECRGPTHLVIMVNGLIGSAKNWRFAAKKFVEKYPQDLIVHCSECNSSMLTFDGVDRMGERLAEEVISVIKRWPKVQKISFIGHSLGGLVARYAIGRLYGRSLKRQTSERSEDCRTDGSGNVSLEEKSDGKIAGLEPMNFITIATPHLGSRGHKQVPIFCGLYVLEKTATHTAWIIGRTGKHLFLVDNDNGKPPLLLQMINDCGDLQFMSALQSFRRHVAYANAHSDHIVGWRTSSIRRQDELPKRKHLPKNDKYPHIVNVEAPKTASSSQQVLSEAKVNGLKTIDMEEAMIRGLTKVGWERVDVSFRRSKQRFFAHSTIQGRSDLHTLPYHSRGLAPQVREADITAINYGMLSGEFDLNTSFQDRPQPPIPGGNGK